MRRRKDGKTNVRRTTASVSINEIDHPKLFSAITGGDGVNLGYFSSTSAFLAAAGERELDRLEDEQVTLEQLKSVVESIALKLEEIKEMGVVVRDDDDDGFGELKEAFDTSM